MARTVSTEEARANLVAMAEVWQRLADKQNEGTDLAEVSAQAPHLAVGQAGPELAVSCANLLDIDILGVDQQPEHLGLGQQRVQQFEPVAPENPIH